MVVLVVLAACGGGDGGIVRPTEKDASLTGVQVTPPTLTLLVGQTGQLQAVPAGPGASTGQATVSFTTSSASVATVSASGLVTAVGPGTASIVATATHPSTSSLNASTVTSSSQVTVSAPPNALTDLTVSPSPLSLTVGSVTQLVVTPVTSAAAVTTTCAAVSSNNVVASTTPNAAVTGVSVGTAVITVTCQGSGGSTTANSLVRTVTVSVTPPPVATIDLTVPNNYLQPGPGTGRTSTTLTAVLRTAQGTIVTDRTVTWSSSLPAVATVSQTGLVSALTTGTTTITVTSEGVSREATINVVRAFAVVSANQPTATTYTSGVNSAGQANNIVRTGVGRYTISFPDLGTNTIGRSFMFMVNAASGAPNATLSAAVNKCHVLGATSNTPVTLQVRCEDPATGADRDAPFRALAIGESALGGIHGFTTHTFGLTTPYAPSALFSFNSANAPMTITPNALPGSFNNVLTSHEQGIAVPTQMTFAQIVTNVSAQTCITRNQQGGTFTDILCFERDTPVDATHQVLRLSEGRPGQIAAGAIWAADDPGNAQGFTSSGPTVITNTGTGKYTVSFPGLSATNGTFGVIASPWSTNEYLHCTHHVVSSSPITIDVACVSATGAFAQSASAIQLLVLR